jgi:hypothetical protein
MSVSGGTGNLEPDWIGVEDFGEKLWSDSSSNRLFKPGKPTLNESPSPHGKLD